MAGDWIPFDRTLPDKLEVMCIVGMTGLTVEKVCLELMLFWCWADSQTEDGFLPGIGVRDLCVFRASRVQGVCTEPREEFYRAMVKVGWLRETPEGVEISNFDHYMGESAKKRLKNARRMRKVRKGQPKQNRNVRPKVHKTRTADARNVHENNTTGQDSTIHINPPPTPLPGGGDVCASEKENAPDDPDADLPPFVASRRPVREVCDAPHHHAAARKVVDHYVAAVNRPGLTKPPGVVAVMDLLDWGVPAATLMRAADAYGAFLKAHGHPPVGTAAFFAEHGDWREYRKGPPKSPPPKPFVAPKLPERTPEELAEASRQLAEMRAKEAARRTGKGVATGTAGGAKPPEAATGGGSGGA